MLIGAVAAAALLYLPGAAALTVGRSSYSGLPHVVASIGLSISLVPLFLLWSSIIGGAWSSESVWIALICAAVIVLWAPIRRRRRGSRPGTEPSIDPSILESGTPARGNRGLLLSIGNHVPEAATIAVVGLALVLRLLDGHALAVPAWVDGYHHTLIAQKILDVGGVPSDLRPWLAVDRFYYHFGFHAVAAAVAWLSGATTADSVLFLGQALCALVALPTWWLTRRLTGSRWAAAFASAVPATLYWFPAYFVAWGRYTQLAGLVVLPVALILLWDAVVEPFKASAAAPRIILAAMTAAGLVLVHYRVAVFYAIGATVALAGAAIVNRRPRATLIRWSAVAALGGSLVAPWLVRHLLDGMRAMESITPEWYAWDPTANAVPKWLFTIGDNPVWLYAGAIGLIAAFLAGRRAALGTVLALGLAAIASNPAMIGLPSSWMLPSFALAISLFMPVAIGIGFGVAETMRAFGHDDQSTGDHTRLNNLLALCLIVIAVSGAWRMHVRVSDGRPSFRTMENQAQTEIFTQADHAGMDWVRRNTPIDAGFLVSTEHWQLGSYRGLDGGYWLPLLTGRRASAPAALYTYGEEEDVLAVQATCEMAARGDALTDSELVRLMGDGSFDHVYVGPAAARHGGFSAERLRRHPRLTETFAADGVHIFRLEP